MKSAIFLDHILPNNNQCPVECFKLNSLIVSFAHLKCRIAASSIVPTSRSFPPVYTILLQLLLTFQASNDDNYLDLSVYGEQSSSKLNNLMNQESTTSCFTWFSGISFGLKIPSNQDKFSNTEYRYVFFYWQQGVI